MSKKLGEILIERGVISAGQLDKALRNQLMLGGHLGTCLLELGFMEESVLGQVLAEVNGVPYATPAHFEQIRSLAIRSLSRKVVEECRAVPLQRNGKDLAVAMVNPRDLAARDSLAFASGCRVVPWVAPEVRVFDAMEKHYGVARRQRYIAISRSRSPLEVGLGRNEDTKAVVIDHPSAAAARREKRDEGTVWGDDPYLRNQRSWREIANELFPEDAAPAKRPDTTMVVAPSPALAESTSSSAPSATTTAATANGQPALLRAAEKLCSADSPEDVARAVLDEVSRLLPRSALFSVKGDDLRFWAGRGMGDSGGSRASVPFPVSSRGIFGHLAGEDSYCGPLRRDSDCQPFYEWLGLRPPAGILLVPVHLNDRLVALIYADADEQRRVETKPAEIERLSRMVGFALTAIIYKNKIRGIGALAHEAHA